MGTDQRPGDDNSASVPRIEGEQQPAKRDQEDAGLEAIEVSINPRTAEYYPVTETKLKDLRRAGLRTSPFLSLSLAGLSVAATAGVALITGTLQGTNPRVVLLVTLLSAFLLGALIFGGLFYYSWTEADQHVEDIKGNPN